MGQQLIQRYELSENFYLAFFCEVLFCCYAFENFLRHLKSFVFSLVDVSEMRLKLSLEPDPSQRPQGVLGVWSPILSVIGNALKIQVMLVKGNS